MLFPKHATPEHRTCGIVFWLSRGRAKRPLCAIRRSLSAAGVRSVTRTGGLARQMTIFAVCVGTRALPGRARFRPRNPSFPEGAPRPGARPGGPARPHIPPNEVTARCMGDLWRRMHRDFGLGVLERRRRARAGGSARAQHRRFAASAGPFWNCERHPQGPDPRFWRAIDGSDTCTHWAGLAARCSVRLVGCDRCRACSRAETQGSRLGFGPGSG